VIDKIIIVLALLLLSGCGEAASCWNDNRGRFTSCEDMRRDEINREIDKREMERGR
jgi:hypothetical protein